MPFNPLSEELKKYLLSQGEREDAGNQMFPEARPIQEIAEQGLSEVPVAEEADMLEMPSAYEAAQRPLRNLTGEEVPTGINPIPPYSTTESDRVTDELLDLAEQRLAARQPKVDTAPAESEMPSAYEAAQRPLRNLVGEEVPTGRNVIPPYGESTKTITTIPAKEEEELVGSVPPQTTEEALKQPLPMPAPIAVPSTTTDPMEYIRQQVAKETAEMARLQQRANLDRELSGIGMALSEAAHGYKNVPFTDAQRRSFEANIKAADRPIEQAKERQKAAAERQTTLDKMFDMTTKHMDAARKAKLSTAGTPESLAVNRMLGKLLPPEMQHLAPDLEKMSAQDAKDYIDSAMIKFSQYGAQKEARETAAEAKKAAAAEKEERVVDKDFMKFGDRLEGGIASSRTAMGRDSNNIRQGGAILALIKQVEETQNYRPDNRQIFEVARALDQMLAQGTGTISGTKHLIPHTFTQQVASMKEFLSGKPSNAEIQDFLRRTKESVQREIEFSQKDLAGIKDRLTVGYSHLQKKDPDRFRDVVRKHGLDVDQTGQVQVPENPIRHGEVVGAPQTETPSTAAKTGKKVSAAALVDYAKKHNITEAQARQTLVKQGYQVE